MYRLNVELSAEWVTVVVTIVGVLLVYWELRQNRLELEQNTTALRTTSYQAMVANSIELLSNLVSDPAMVTLFRNGLEDRGPKDEVTRARWGYMILGLMRHFENLHYQHEKGTIEKGNWSGYDQLIRHYAKLPGVAIWWAENQKYFSDQFQDYFRAARRSDSVDGRG